MAPIVDLPVRRRLRLCGFDYRKRRAYFVTVCAAYRDTIFGRIIDRRVHLSAAGSAVVQSCRWVCDCYPWVHIVAGVVMPDHVHLLVVLEPGPTPRKPLGQIVGALKSHATRRIDELQGTAGTQVWQRGFHDRVIRNVAELEWYQHYIASNPARWAARHPGTNT